MSMYVQMSQVHKTATRSQDDGKRLCLVDDLKEVQVHIQVKTIRTSSSLKSKITTSYSQDEVKYLKGAPGMGVLYRANNGFELTTFVDSDWAKCNVIRLSVTGYVVFLDSCLVSWKMKAVLDYEKHGHAETKRKVAEEKILKGLLLNLSHVKELKIGDSCQKALSRLEAKGFTLPLDMKYPDFIPLPFWIGF
ncbi:hypothetical protein Tco_1384610 [Tanacetum coccineum]